MNDEELGCILRCLDPQEAADTLVDLANLRGGPDNISVVIAKVDGAVPRVAPAENKSESSQATRPSKTGPLWFAAGVCLAVLAYCVAREFWAMAIGCGIGFLAAVGAVLVIIVLYRQLSTDRTNWRTLRQWPLSQGELCTKREDCRCACGYRRQNPKSARKRRR